MIYGIVIDFFSPANIMKLLEIVKASDTAVTTVAACVNAGKAIGKTSAVAGNCYGFIGNRWVLTGYYRWCLYYDQHLSR